MVSFIRKTFGSVLTSDEVNDYQVAIEDTDAAVTAHLADTNNPHAVDKTDVGLSNVPNTNATARSSHTGTQDADTITDGTTNKAYTASEKTKLSGIESAADVTDAGNVGSSIHGATGKTTPVDADTTSLIDSAASNVLKKVTWANVKATLKTYFDTLYATASHTQTLSTITDVTASAAELNALDGITSTVTELNYTDGVTSAIQTQLDAKVPTSRTINGSDLSANRTFTQDAIGDGTTYKQYSQTEKTKLAGIETAADVTDAVNIASAFNGLSTAFLDMADGMVILDDDASDVLKRITYGDVISDLNDKYVRTDATSATWPWTIDEDTMTSNSATKLPTQQSVKAYVDSGVSIGGLSADTIVSGDSIPFSDTSAFGLGKRTTFADFKTALGLSAGQIHVEFHGGGAVIPTNQEVFVCINKACTITGWKIFSTVSGSIVVGVQKDTYANFPPVSGDSIAGTNKPTLSSAVKAENTTLSGWGSTSVSSGDVIRFVVESVTTCTDVFLDIFTTS